MKNIKMLAMATMVSLGALGMVACNKNEDNIQIQTDQQGTGIGEYKGDVEVTIGGNKESQTFANGYTVQFTDPSKANYRVPGYALDKNGNYDEKTWEKGPNGFKVPPEGIRNYDKNYPEDYTICYHDLEGNRDLNVAFTLNSRHSDERQIKDGSVSIYICGNAKTSIDEMVKVVNTLDKAGKNNKK